MKRFAILLWVGLLAGCATEYQPQSFTGGFSDYMTAPDETVVTFHGNGYTPAERVYHLQLHYGQAEGSVPPEVAAFIAVACWARQVLLGEGKE
jgi:hypothetical protein